MRSSINFCDGSAVTFSFERVLANNMRTCHSHNAYELYFLVEGERYLYVDGGFYRLCAGDIFLVAPGVIHRTLDEGGYSKFVAMLPRSLVPASFTDSVKIVRAGERDAESLASDISLSTGESSDGRWLFTLTRLLSLVLSLPGCTERTVESPTIGRMGAILDYVESHFTEKLSLTALAERFYISEYYLCRLFKEYTGRTFNEYLGILRTDRAKLLLSEGISVGRVWRQSGFGSESSFNRIFRERAGCSPREWKSKNT